MKLLKFTAIGKLRVVRENLLVQSGRELLNTAGELSLFYERVIEGVELQPAVSREDLLTVIYGKSQIDLTLARSVARTPYTAFEGTENPYINQTRCSNVRNSQGQAVRQCFTVQVEKPPLPPISARGETICSGSTYQTDLTVNSEVGRN